MVSSTLYDVITRTVSVKYGGVTQEAREGAQSIAAHASRDDAPTAEKRGERREATRFLYAQALETSLYIWGP